MKALDGDQQLQKEYKAAHTKAKLEFKRKWADTLIAEGGLKRKAKTQSNFQTQTAGRKGKWVSAWKLKQDEGEEVANNIIKNCERKKWTEWDNDREVTLYFIGTRVGNDMNCKKWGVNETEDLILVGL
eukprot:5992788-Amphidinium_carterae.1